VYNIGGGRELTNRQLTEVLLEATGRDWSAVRPVEDRKGHDRRYSLSHEKIANELGYAPAVTFEDGIAATVAWYKENRSWWEPLKTRAAL
jgi:dTDP-glucose 4,6-dehydratase